MAKMGDKKKSILVDERTVAKLSQIRNAYLDQNGQEINNPKPAFLEVTPNPPTMQEQIQRILKFELAKQADAQGMETWEEANDFDVIDEFDGIPESEYELMDDDLLIPMDADPQAVENEPQKPAETPPVEEPQPTGGNE